MIVEFIGSTGAGKTTLISAVRRQLAANASVASSFEVVAGLVGAQNVANPTLQNVIQEAVGLPFFIRTLRRHQPLLSFALQMLARQRSVSFSTLSYLRNLERTLGVNEILRRRARNQIVLVDEGAVLSAHSLFVYTDAVYSADEIARFASLAPLPDLVVYITAPVETLVERTHRRPDPPRELRGIDPALLTHYIRRAVSVFAQLTQTEAMRSRVLTVENSEPAAHAVERVAAQVAAFIQSSRSYHLTC
jgi:thymidylate kinase